MKSFKVAFLGVGNMGNALIAGAVRSKFLRPIEIKAFDVDGAKLRKLKSKLKIQVCGSALKAVENCDYVFLCVKPQQMESLLAEISAILQMDQCLVSIAAGISAGQIESNFRFPVRAIRVMPNTPALVGAGMSVITKGKHGSSSDLAFCQKFFKAVGEVMVLPEERFDAVTAVSGSGPAYLFYLTESLERAAEQAGLPKEAAQKLSRATMIGAAKLLEGLDSPEELRRKVTSPGGTTEAAIKHLESQNWQQIFVDAIRKAKERSKELRNAQSK